MKTYDPAALRQVRLKELLTFVCDRCGKEKRSKNVVHVGADQVEGTMPVLCNGCYGALLSKT